MEGRGPPVRLPRSPRTRHALLGAGALVTLAWPLLTRHVLPGGSLRRQKVAPALIQAWREMAGWLHEPAPDLAGLDDDVRAARERWQRGDPAGIWRFDDPRYPLYRTRTGDCAARAGASLIERLHGRLWQRYSMERITDRVCQAGFEILHREGSLHVNGHVWKLLTIPRAGGAGVRRPPGADHRPAGLGLSAVTSANRYRPKRGRSAFSGPRRGAAG